MEYVKLFVVLGQGCTSGLSDAVSLGRFAPHLARDFGHTLHDAPAERAHFATKVRNRPLSNVLGQITAPLQLGQDQQYADQVPKDQPVYVICRAGSRSARAAQVLGANGWNVTNVSDGMQGWESAGRPMVSESGTPPFVA